jgi:hypothetical protein
MPLINELAREPIAGAHGESAHGVVRRRGVALGAGQRRLSFEQRVPVAFVVETRGNIERFDVPRSGFNPLPLVLPALGYIAVRIMLKRRHSR